MGWTEQIPNLIIFTSTSGGFTGLYCYDPAPGTGNLLVSIAAPSVGTDPFGNAVTGGGLAVYDAVGGNEGRQIFVGPKAISIRTGQATEATHAIITQSVAGTVLGVHIESATSTGAGDQAEIDLNSNNSTGSSVAQGVIIYNDTGAVEHIYASWDASGFNVAAGSILAVNPTSGTLGTPATAETWHSLGSPSATGYTSNINQYKLLPDGDAVIDVQLTANGGGGTAGTYNYANSLPAAYRPPVNRFYGLGWDSTVTAGMSFPVLIVDHSGTVQVKLPALAAGVVVSGTIRVPLQ